MFLCQSTFFIYVPLIILLFSLLLSAGWGRLVFRSIAGLVLGAFGCGAFCNPPMIVARAFRNVQEKYDGYFDTIEYAVFCKKNETENYDAFCREFPKTRFKS